MKRTLRTRALIGIAVAIAAYLVFSSGDDTATSPSTVHTGAARAPARHHGESRPQLQAPTRAMLKDRVSEGTGAATLFASHSWYRPPPPPPAAPPQPRLSAEQLAALNKPTAPPLPYAFMGSYRPAGQPPVFFLTRADRVYDVHLGDIIDSIYSVDAFDGKQLLMTYKPLNIQQQLSAEGSQ